MSTDNHMPDWVRTLLEEIGSGIRIQGTRVIWKDIIPRLIETSWGIHLLEMAPALMDLSELGAEEGEQGYGIMHSFDLLATQEAFDEVAGLFIWHRK